MKILIVDRDEMSAQLTSTKLKNLGHEVSEETVKNDAIEKLATDGFDVLLVDPAPLTSARNIMLSVRRNAGRYTYCLLMSSEGGEEHALSEGMNGFLPKPVDTNLLEEKIQYASCLSDLIDRIGDDSEDFPSAGGVIAKSAFNQLFLSALDRANRYAEQTYVLFISLDNYQEIYDLDGAYAADYVVAKLSQSLVRMRRQSDIIGQTAKYEHALLLLERRSHESEPVEAANRFAHSFSEMHDLSGDAKTPVKIKVQLIALPVGRAVVEHVVSVGGDDKKQ